MKIQVSSPIEETPRVQQVAGMFDLTLAQTSDVAWDVELPLSDKKWSVGLITGPSGCGKSTIARELFRASHWLTSLPAWPQKESVMDGFPEDMSVRDITELLGAVGFSSPPAWIRPYHVLSQGQQFRCDLARLLGTTRGRVAVCDEFTSVVDRTVAQIGSHAVAKTVRTRGQKFVAVSCHEDIIDWLQPDWIYRPAENQFSWRSLRRRPAIKLEVARVSNKIWKLFAPHHYLNHALAPGSWAFVASWRDRPVAFSAWMPYVGVGPLTRREHRTVVLPDYQGCGIGMAISDCIASMWRGLGYQVKSTTTHPGFKQARAKSPNWVQTRKAGLTLRNVEKGKYKGMSHARTRMTSGWQFVGEPMALRLAKNLLGE